VPKGWTWEKKGESDEKVGSQGSRHRKGGGRRVLCPGMVFHQLGEGDWKRGVVVFFGADNG